MRSRVLLGCQIDWSVSYEDAQRTRHAIFRLSWGSGEGKRKIAWEALRVSAQEANLQPTLEIVDLLTDENQLPEGWVRHYCDTCSARWLVPCAPQAPPCEPAVVGTQGSRPESAHSPSSRDIESDTIQDFRLSINARQTMYWYISQRKKIKMYLFSHRYEKRKKAHRIVLEKKQKNIKPHLWTKWP